MANTTISFEIDSTILVELGAAVAPVFDRNEGESDADLINRFNKTGLLILLNKTRAAEAKRAAEATLTEATSLSV